MQNAWDGMPLVRARYSTSMQASLPPCGLLLPTLGPWRLHSVCRRGRFLLGPFIARALPCWCRLSLDSKHSNHRLKSGRVAPTVHDSLAPPPVERPEAL